ncbi:MAG: fumarylacetoacetate hydrolase family protein [Bacteroidetes bacterium]|jgi:2-keto-4-pentenoate hydratase/2-oxohepta-3-ene-1,7-dioic acid hydratase in catechol pathway|nr:fumarylacetoacetate hydrolase family protein [Bacteroidota bacterium]MDF1865215.1 fumarylacetoacetate hydrolase family protein [Saprospiraceae bacterium]
MKIICIGRNYIDHAKELNNPVPKKPLVFMKPPSALLVNNKPLYYPEFTEDLHYEGEIVLKICKNGRYVQPEFAHKYFQEIGFGIDFTARDIQRQCKEKGHPWEIAKGFDGSAAMSSFMAIDQVDPTAIEFQMLLNGEVVQHGNTKDLIFSFTDIIVYVSKFFRLQFGDLIFTGTPAGVGPVKIGDKLEGKIFTKEGAKEMIRCDIR